MLVIHGHQFDGTLNPNRLLPIIGTNAYARAQRIHDWYHGQSEPEASQARSLSDYFRHPARRAFEFLTDFRDRAVLAAAREHKADGVICGHIHRADHRLIRTIIYVNDGDWVQSRTAAVEEPEGTIQVLRCAGSHPKTPQSEATSQGVARLRSGIREIRFHAFACVPGPRIFSVEASLPDRSERWLLPRRASPS
jgi:hypothetical protein